MVKLGTCIKTAAAGVTARASGQQHTHTQNGKETLYSKNHCTLMFENILTQFTPATWSAETVT
jgi:hypothetical protein